MEDTIKSKANVNVYLLLFKKNKVLLSLRKNTGYEDGKWSLVSGHVETGESALNALIREAKEEIGIDIIINNLKVTHIMHRMSDRENIDLFITCGTWENEIKNQEPDKCEDLNFFEISNLPENTIDYIKKGIDLMCDKNMIYSETGWVL